MRYRSFTLILSSVVPFMGCERGAPPPSEPIAEDEASSQTFEQIANDERVQRLKEYADKRMERLLTATGEGIKTIDWDLSKDNQISLVGWPQQEVSDEYIINQEIDLSIHFPAGFSVKTRATLLICDRDAPTSDRLHSISFHLPKRTTEDTFQLTKEYITRWRLQKNYTTEKALGDLDEWYAAAKIGNAGTFLAARHDNYPIIDLKILRSYDDSQLWFISIYFAVSKPPLPTEVVDCFDAIRMGDASAAIELIEGGVNPNSRSVYDDSLLHQAAESGRIELVRYLIDRGAHVDATGSYGQTPFWDAVLDGHLAVAQLLLDNGADINCRSHNGGTILHYVCEYITEPVPNDKLAQWLINHGAQVDAADNCGDTPLHKSAWKGHVAAASVLISSNADIHAKNEEGMTPLDNAHRQHQTQIEELLRQYAREAISEQPAGIN